ncbi:MAG: hypothetical protein HZB38_13730 [Planctomycetes bacterium]|nr:hypothetical protein [Planctomycetota bacterium]
MDNIEPAVRQARKANPAANSELLTARSVEANVFQSISDILSRSGEVRELTKEGKVKVVGAVYDIATGSVRWLGAHPEQSSLVFGKPRSDDPHAGHGGAAAHTAVAGAKATKANGSSHSESGNAGQSTPAGGGHGAVGLPTPQQAFEMLRDGNQRFFSGAPQHPHCDKERLASTAKGQHPYATVLSCADSRVPVERLFDQGIGDVFVVRFAGNVADTDEIASIEYATGHLGTPLLVVLGHSSCGAVSAVVGNAELHGCLPALVDNIQPAVARARNANPGLGGDPLIAAAIRANVFQSMNDLLANSPGVRKLVEAGKLRIVGGMYDLASGKVEWLRDPLTADGADPKPAAAPSAKPADAPQSSAEPAESAKDAHGEHDGHGGR